ncbi:MULTISPECIES: restriction endonuclease subunit S [unclassified Providencia]|uniref:restriction endonuclease subunit S n=1 Tax=unclassified Providencia TaxID=2633465 RepID=UPI00234A48B5|nr:MULTISPECIES: restriction endonuclease subunit S [unclassified Providencia]
MENITSTPKYDQYIDSGYEWIGEIPLHWDLGKLGSCLFPVSVKNCPELPLLSITREQGVIERDVDDQESNHNFIPDDLSGYKKLEKGQFGMNKMKAWQGSYGVSKFTGIVSPAYFVFDFTKAINPEFFNWAIRSKLYVSFFGSASDGVRIGQWDLSKTRMKVIPFVLPSEEEQSLIANFLDKKTALIDEAISIKEQQISLLKERKQIIIQQAVTQGLDPNVPMKDSGVDWIGKIPAHWEVKRLKYVTKILKRIIGYEGPDVLSITQKGIKVKDIESGEGQLAMDYSKYQIVRVGDFAMNHMDLLTGYVDISQFEGVVSPDYRVFINTYNGLRDDFLLSIFQLGYQQKIFYRYGQGVSLLGRWRFPADNFNNFFIPVPPIEEQAEVVQSVQREWLKLDNAIELLISQIEKLKEYKTTLINSAVTGKIKITPEMVEQ